MIIDLFDIDAISQIYDIDFTESMNFQSNKCKIYMEKRWKKNTMKRFAQTEQKNYLEKAGLQRSMRKS